MKYLPFIFAAAFLFSCGEDPEEKVEPDFDGPVDARDDFQEVDQDFNSGEFKNPTHLKLLKELDICVDLPQDSTSYATCDPKNFQILEFRDDKPVEDAFILVIRAVRMLPGGRGILPDRVVQVWERENGELVNVNNFVGNLIAMRPGEGKIKDMVLQLNDPVDDASYDCYFKWDDSQFQFDQVMAIDFHDGKGPKAVKEEMIESVSKDVYNSLVERKIIYYGR